jgi:hypothetical protein
MIKNKLFVILTLISILGCQDKLVDTTIQGNELNAKIEFKLDYSETLVIKVPPIIGAKIEYDYPDYTGDNLRAWNKYKILYDRKDTAIIRIITDVTKNREDSGVYDTAKIFRFLYKSIRDEDITRKQFKNEIIDISGKKLYTTFYNYGFMAYWHYKERSYTILLYKMKDTLLSHSIAKSISVDSNRREYFW